MTTKWERFAVENAEYYIIPENTDYSTTEGKKRFFNSGEEFTKQTLEAVLPLLTGKERALEIGSGVGRLTLPHSKFFGEIIAVDISPTMLAKLDQNARKFGQDNIKTFLPNENWDSFSFDYAFSYIVFQHVENFQIIRDYIIRISSSLKSGGIAQLHFDTRKRNILYYIRNILPDFFLPKSQKNGIRRIRRTSENLRILFDKQNLKIIQEMFPDSERHIFILKKF